jgi:ubiquinone/menaquinone biosynthesis C-methylase UbiE
VEGALPRSLYLLMKQKLYKQFVPAAHWHCLTRFYDPLVSLFLGNTFKKMVRALTLNGNEKLLDLGCGSGNLLAEIKTRKPSTDLVGVDIDSNILNIAGKKKILRDVDFIESSITELPFANETFDVAVSSLVFHHLSCDQKKEALNEIFRVLKSGGVFWYFDFGNPVNLFGRLFTWGVKFIEDIEDNVKNRAPAMIVNAGFHSVKRHWTSYGSLVLLSAVKL